MDYYYYCCWILKHTIECRFPLRAVGNLWCAPSRIPFSFASRFVVLHKTKKSVLRQNRNETNAQNSFFSFSKITISHLAGITKHIIRLPTPTSGASWYPLHDLFPVPSAPPINRPSHQFHHLKVTIMRWRRRRNRKEGVAAGEPVQPLLPVPSARTGLALVCVQWEVHQVWQTRQV
jgi:hypothetical protein